MTGEGYTLIGGAAGVALVILVGLIVAVRWGDRRNK